jgi:putative transposase
VPRTARQTPGRFVYHTLYRVTARLTLFHKAADFAAFVRVLEEALDKYRARLPADCVMPSHWHFVLWPDRDGQLTAFHR